jgi:pimeloyl-ACP methyl ester carboxylesterase
MDQLGRSWSARGRLLHEAGFKRWAAQAVTIDAQVEHLRALLGPEPVHMVGHSVGGVIAALYAHRYADDVLGMISVEGNFTLADAFWSAELARTPTAEAAALLEAHRADPAAWFGNTRDPYEIDSARTMLAFQPVSTLQSMAASVVAVTGASTWEPLIREVFSRTSVHLVAGQASQAQWNVPDWALTAAVSYTELPGVGHAMMFQKPETFGDTLANLIRSGSGIAGAADAFWKLRGPTMARGDQTRHRAVRTSRRTPQSMAARATS